MYQLELAGLEIFHMLYFPERSPSFLSLPLSQTLFSLQSRRFVFLKTTCEDWAFLYRNNSKKKRLWSEKNRMYEANVVAKRGNGHFLHVPILSCHVGGRLQFYTREGKVERPKKKNTEAENITTKGEGGREKKGTRKIKMFQELRQAGSCPWA